MANAEDIAREEAIAWRVRLGSADEVQWDAFLDWLDRDPVHRLAYDRVAASDAVLGDSLAEQRPMKSPAREQLVLRPRRYVGVAALAAAIVLLILAYPLLFESRPLPFAPRSWAAVETRPGERRVLALAEGSRIFLNGDTRILLDRGDRRFARLERGEAAFEIKHRDNYRFTVEVNGAKVVDLGTVFNISTSPRGFDLAVAQGSVVLNPGAENVRLTRGGRLFVPRRDGPISVGSVEVGTIASWRRDQLIYNHEPLQAVALDLMRSLGTRVSVAPAVKAMPFTGVIMLDDDKRVFRRLESLLGIRASRTGNEWRLEPANRATDPSGAVRGGR